MTEQIFSGIVRFTFAYRQRMIRRVGESIVRIVHVISIVDHRAHKSTRTNCYRLQDVSSEMDQFINLYRRFQNNISNKCLIIGS